jgi:hypothetical protein
MTEAEWLACVHPIPMLEFMRGKVSDRKLRLFAVACCQAVSPYFPSAEYDEMVQWAEWFADGVASKRQFIQRFRRFARRFNGKVAQAIYPLAEERALLAAVEVARRTFIFPPFGPNNAHSLVLKEVAGNPFRPVAVDPSWLTSTVIALATGIYEDRAFDRMPYLGDALQDAECDSDELLNHCRSNGPHVRGCWVVDLLLGKS